MGDPVLMHIFFYIACAVLIVLGILLALILFAALRVLWGVEQILERLKSLARKFIK